MTERCPQGHLLREVSRVRVREVVEDVVYTMQTIKKFNREGAESMEDVRIPEFVEREVEIDEVRYACDRCGTSESVRRPAKGPGPEPA
jgi:hypothetical protein